MAYAFFIGGQDTDYIEHRIEEVRKKFGPNFVSEESTAGKATAEQVHWNNNHEKGRGSLPAIIIGGAKTLDDALFGEPTKRLLAMDEWVDVPNVLDQGFAGKIVLFEGGHEALQEKLEAANISVSTIKCPGANREAGARGVFQKGLEKEILAAGVELAERAVVR